MQNLNEKFMIGLESYADFRNEIFKMFYMPQMFYILFLNLIIYFLSELVKMLLV